MEQASNIKSYVTDQIIQVSLELDRNTVMGGNAALSESHVKQSQSRHNARGRWNFHLLLSAGKTSFS